ncbi:putative RING-H2 finger protein ATL72 [Cocos nucifera]|uniref:Putative RING-H2 finger protein ATL72 n=1 Tax=Cocos nucifera TaxID=13894 RepID=A0A8K0N813_COCNU|nr:putative RING-H2 finger protein ATL72 [Cocos nucifera]
MSFHRHRRLVDEYYVTAGQLGGRVWVAATIGFVAALSVYVAYVIIDVIIKWFVGHGPQPDNNATANPENGRTVTAVGAQDPRGSVQIQAIPVLIYVDLPSCSSTRPEAEICPVCLGDYAAGEEVRVLPKCGHMFHKDCIDRWLISRSSSCPICRAPAIKQLGVPTGD